MSAHESGKISDALSAVEKELAALWTSADGGETKSRACTANLVLLAPHARRAAAVKLSSELETAEIARTFVVSTDPHLAPWAIASSVSARCRKADAGVVCAESIELSLGAATFSRAASIVSTLAMSEVPTVLVMIDAAPELLGVPLAHDASRIIVDTETIGLEAAHALAKANSARLVDLAWERLLPWRSLIAGIFDDESARAGVTAIRRLSIHAAPSTHLGVSPSARLLLGWLASRLGWRFVVSAGASGESILTASDAIHGVIELDVTTSKEDIHPASGALLSVELTTTIGDTTRTLCISREDSPPRLHTECDIEGATRSRNVTLGASSIAAQVDRAVTDIAPDFVLRDALKCAIAYRLPPTPVAEHARESSAL